MITTEEYWKLRGSDDSRLLWILYDEECAKRGIKRLVNTYDNFLLALKLWNKRNILNNFLKQYDDTIKSNSTEL